MMNKEDQDFLCQYAAEVSLKNRQFKEAYGDLKDLLRLRGTPITKDAILAEADKMIRVGRITDNLDVMECKGVLRQLWVKEFGDGK